VRDEGELVDCDSVVIKFIAPDKQIISKFMVRVVTGIYQCTFESALYKPGTWGYQIEATGNVKGISIGAFVVSPVLI
jgi:hypothetical protein